MNRSKLVVIRLMLALTVALCVGGCALWDAANGSSSEPRADASDLDAIDGPDALHDGSGADDIVHEDVSTDARDASVEDVSPDIAEPSACEGSLAAATFALDQGDEPKQTYISAAFDGTGIWVVYTMSVAQTSGDRDIYAARILCDGTVDVAPMKLNDRSITGISPKPRIDIRDGTVHLVWGDRDEGSPKSITTYMKFAADDAAVRTAGPKTVEFALSNLTDLLQDLSEPDVLALPDGKAAIVATVTFAATRQIYIQPLNADGGAASDAIPVHPDADFTQAAPSIAALSSDKVWLTWYQAKITSSTDREVAYRWLNLANPDEGSATKIEASGLIAESRSALAKNIVHPDHVYFVFNTLLAGRSMMAVKNAASSAEAVGFGVVGDSNTRPAVAARPGGGALAWYSSDGLAEEANVVVQSFTDNGEIILHSDQQKLSSADTIDLAQRGPSIVYIGGDNYFVTWPQPKGPSGEFKIVWRFVSLSE